MARSISNMNQLAFALAPILQGMVNQMTDRVYKTLNFYLQDGHHRAIGEPTTFCIRQ